MSPQQACQLWGEFANLIYGLAGDLFAQYGPAASTGAGRAPIAVTTRVTPLAAEAQCAAGAAHREKRSRVSAHVLTGSRIVTHRILLKWNTHAKNPPHGNAGGRSQTPRFERWTRENCAGKQAAVAARFRFLCSYTFTANLVGMGVFSAPRGHFTPDTNFPDATMRIVTTTQMSVTACEKWSN